MAAGQDLFQYIEQTGSTWKTLSASGYTKEVKKLVDNGSFVMKRYYDQLLLTFSDIAKMEFQIAERLIDHLHAKNPNLPSVSDETIDLLINEFESIESEKLHCCFKLAKEQRSGVHMAIRNHVCILTGGPGTGKTCVLKAIAFVFRKIMSCPSICFTAPTGKAARRVTESTGKNACTLQKKLGLTYINKEPRSICDDVLIVDEVSMLDLETFHALTKGLCCNTALILVGDTDQLPSVACGAVLRDLISSNAIPVTKLQKPQRQNQESNIFLNIDNLRRGFGELSLGSDFYLYPSSDNDGQQILIRTYLDSVKEWGADNVICLTPYRRVGKTCANVINDIIQEKLNPIGNKPYLKTLITDEETGKKRKIRFQTGDPVIQLLNREECANGDVGKIVKVSASGITVQYIDCSVYYPKRDLDQLELAYAMSIHKSQGSEYPCVVTPVLPEHMEMLDRNMLYTAVTRAKKCVKIVGDKNVILESVKTESSGKRITQLSQEIVLAERRWKLVHF